MTGHTALEGAAGNRPVQVFVTAEPGRELVKRLSLELGEEYQVQGVPVTTVEVLTAGQTDQTGWLRQADWLVFTSVRAVKYFRAEPAANRQIKVCAVGQATSNVASTAGWPVTLVAGGSAQQLLRIFPATTSGGRVLLPGSALRKPDLAQGLVGLGWRVESLDTYTMRPVDRLAGDYRSADYIVVTSGSNFSSLHGHYPNLFRACPTGSDPAEPEGNGGISRGDCGLDRTRFTPPTGEGRVQTFNPPQLVCIGQPTARVAVQAGVTPNRIAKQPTASALAQAIKTTSPVQPLPAFGEHPERKPEGTNRTPTV